jgi:hypothetical protein
MKTAIRLTNKNGPTVHVTYENTSLLQPHGKHQYGGRAWSPFIKKVKSIF